MATQEASRSGKVVFEIDNLSVRFGEQRTNYQRLLSVGIAWRSYSA